MIYAIYATSTTELIQMIEAIRITRPDRKKPYLLELGDPPHSRHQFHSLEEMRQWLRSPLPINWVAIHFRTSAGKPYTTVIEYDPLPGTAKVNPHPSPTGFGDGWGHKETQFLDVDDI